MASPIKRRALAPLNANATMSPSAVPDSKKRASLANDTPAAKKTCLDLSSTATTTAARSRTTSPVSSVFDNNSEGEDSSWATEHSDAGAAAAAAALMALPPPARTGGLTRDQAREVRFRVLFVSFERIYANSLVQRAQILRLRLGLANYKLRTGQTLVPLDNLQVKPMTPRVVIPSSQEDSIPSFSGSQDFPSSQDDVVVATPASEPDSPKLMPATAPATACT